MEERSEKKSDLIDCLRRAYEREKKARREVEKVIEEKNLRLYGAYKNLEKFNQSLELKVNERTKELQEARDRAEELAKFKQQFLANMSHEIRTPINAVIGFTELLSKSDLLSEEKEYVDIIKVSAENLLAIINDILDISKVESGKLVLEPVKIDVRKLISNVILTFSDKALRKKLQLNYYIDPKAAQCLIVDKVRLNQVLINLLSNAIKFTEVGLVSLTCTCVSDDNTFQVLEFKITDTGIGIEKDRIDKVFERFSQEDESITRRYGGTGLGLHIVKQLVDLFNGTVTVESVKGVGTAFIVRIPMKKSSAEKGQNLDKTSIETVEPPRRLNKIRVLVAEDNEFNRLLVKTLLEKEGAMCDFAGNGDEAIEKLVKFNYDAILMDIQMPVKDGLEATKIIRNDLRLRTPIIALTANALIADKEKYLKAGMEGYLSKPFNADDLFSVIRSVTSKSKKGVVQLDFEQLRDLSKNDSSFYENLLNLIFEDLKLFDILIRETGKQDPPAIKAQIHKLKSQIKLLGDVEMYSRLVTAEDLTFGTDDYNDQINWLRKRAEVSINCVAKEIEKCKANHVQSAPIGYDDNGN